MKVMKITKSTVAAPFALVSAITGSGSYISFNAKKGMVNLSVKAIEALEGATRVDLFIEEGSIAVRPATSPASGFALSGQQFYSIGLYNMAKSMLGEDPCGKRFYSKEGEATTFTPEFAIDRKEARRKTRKVQRKSRMKTFSAKVIAKNKIQDREIFKALNEKSARVKLQKKWGKTVNITKLTMLAGKDSKAV